MQSETFKINTWTHLQERLKTTKPILLFWLLALPQKICASATQELYNRLNRLGLVKSLLFDCYDTLHAESIAGVVWNVEEALRNWEKEGGINSSNLH